MDIPQWAARAGELHAVLGANGAGKSSFFSILSGELAYTGHVHLHQRALHEWPLRQRARHLGVLPQQSQMSFAFTAAEVVALGLTPLSLHWRKAQARVRQMLELTGCSALAGRAYPSLSGGERQRVNLARVLLQLSEAEASPLLLLDEPTSAQDLGQQHSVMTLARRLAHEEGFAVVAILHDLNQALRYCDGCLLLRDGRPVYEGTPAQALTAQRVQDIWGYRPTSIQTDGHVALI